LLVVAKYAISPFLNNNIKYIWYWKDSFDTKDVLDEDEEG
jgi:hypothetical protein